MAITVGVMMSNSLLTMIQNRTFYEVCFSFFSRGKELCSSKDILYTSHNIFLVGLMNYFFPVRKLYASFMSAS
jgi:hypothetical protein